MKLSVIFEDKPKRWGFRGDPYFWDYLKERAEQMELLSPDELEAWIKQEYLSLSGKILTDEYMDFAVIKQFAHGGMSSGGVDNRWWMEEGIPLLKSRLAAFGYLSGGKTMDHEVVRHIHKYVYAMYVMVSIPEAKKESIFKSPIILGVFETKEDAKNAWKARTAEYKSIKAKTVHVYYFDFRTDVPVIPETVFFTGSYTVSEWGGNLHFDFIPSDGFPDIESHYNRNEWLSSLHPMSFRENCERSDGWKTFYASNQMFCIECPVNRLVNIAVPLTDVASELDWAQQ